MSTSLPLRLGAGGVVVQHLVDGQAGGRGHALEVADVDAVDGGVDAVVAGRGARGVRAVAVEVARGVELARVGVGEAGGVEPACADHLVVAGHRGRVGPRVAGAVPLRVDDGWSGRGSGAAAKLGFSGQKPESMTPMMTPLPACAGPPNSCFHTAVPGQAEERGVGGCGPAVRQAGGGPGGAGRSGERDRPSLGFNPARRLDREDPCFFSTIATPGVLRSVEACFAVIFSTTPLSTVVNR